MFPEIAPAKQCSSQQILSVAARGGNNLMGDRFVAPNKHATLRHHPAEEVHILSRSIKLGVERGLARIQDVSLEKNIARARLIPVESVSCRVHWPVEEPTLLYPVGRLLLEIRQHGPENSISPILCTRLEQTAEPVIFRVFVVIKESDEIALGVLDRLVPGKRDIGFRLKAPFHTHTAGRGKSRNDPSRRLFRVIVGHDDRIIE